MNLHFSMVDQLHYHSQLMNGVHTRVDQLLNSRSQNTCQRFGACWVAIWVLGNNTHYLANFSQSRLFRERPLMHGQKKWSKSLSFSLSNLKNHECSRLNTTLHATISISQLPGWSVGSLVGYMLVCWLVGRWVRRLVGWSVGWSVINEFLFLSSSEQLAIGGCFEWLVSRLVD